MHKVWSLHAVSTLEKHQLKEQKPTILSSKNWTISSSRKQPKKGIFFFLHCLFFEHDLFHSINFLHLIPQLPQRVWGIFVWFPRIDNGYLDMLQRRWYCQRQQHPRHNCRIPSQQDSSQQIHIIALRSEFFPLPYSQVTFLNSYS